MPDTTVHIAFLDLLKGQPETSYIGAVLVTDSLGVPVEFRCTHPVKPTEIQRQLYGSTLQRHVGVELCGKPLLKSLQNPPRLVFTKLELLLGVREASPVPVLFVRYAGEVLRVDQGPAGGGTEVKVDPKNSNIQPIILRSDARFESDPETAKEILEEVLLNVDPIEPFERINKAVAMLIKQDARFQ